MSDTPAVTHIPERHRFELKVGEHLAYVEYELKGYSIDFTHTFVPGELRGRGIAAILAKEALAYAARERLKVIPSCSYIATYLQRNPQG